jgi:hypothetical protein
MLCINLWYAPIFRMRPRGSLILSFIPLVVHRCPSFTLLPFAISSPPNHVYVLRNHRRSVNVLCCVSMLFDSRLHRFQPSLIEQLLPPFVGCISLYAV